MTPAPTSRLDELDAQLCALRAEVRARQLRTVDRTDPVSALAAALRRLKLADSPVRLAQRACAELRDALGFDKALLSFIDDDEFVVEDSGQGPGGPHRIAHRDCPTERECVWTRTTVCADGSNLSAAPGYRQLLDSPNYLVAPVIIESQVVALLHATPGRRAELIAGDGDVLDAFASAYALLYERLRNSQWVQHQRTAIVAAAARLTEQTDRIAKAAIGFHAEPDEAMVARATMAGSELAAALSGRERQVFELLVVGASNADIADDLVVTVETVKTHVKNILRKIGAVNRAEAIALYLDEELRRRFA